MKTVLTDSLRKWAEEAGVPHDAPDSAFARCIKRALFSGVMSAEALVKFTAPEILDMEAKERAEIVATWQQAIDEAKAEHEAERRHRAKLAEYKAGFARCGEWADTDCPLTVEITRELRNWAWQQYQLDPADVEKDRLVRQLALLALKEGDLTPEIYCDLIGDAGLVPTIKQALSELDAPSADDDKILATANRIAARA